MSDLTQKEIEKLSRAKADRISSAIAELVGIGLSEPVAEMLVLGKKDPAESNRLYLGRSLRPYMKSKNKKTLR